MSALTRIFNNQIYNATIVASQKIAPGSIVGSLFSSNITIPGDLLVSGNLQVLGSSAVTTVASTNTYVNDPLIALNNGFSGTNTYDEGLIFNRGTSQNQAFIWSEYFGEFRLISTNETGTTYGNVNSAGLSRLSIGSLNVPGQANIGILSTSGAITANGLNISGNILASTIIASYYSGSTATFGNVAAVTVGNVGTQFNGATINLSGNVLATGGIFNALTVNGNQSINSGYLNVQGNILGQGATFSSILVNGNSTITGYVNVSGNLLASVITVSQISANNSTGTNGQFLQSTGTGLSWVALAPYEIFSGGSNVTVTSNWVNVAIASSNVLTIGNSYTALSTGFFNVSGNLLASTITGTTAAFSGNVIGGLAQFAAINSTPVGNATASTGAFTTLTASGITTLTNNTNATSNGTGALQVTGGASIGGNLWVGGNLNVLGNNYTISGNAGVFYGNAVGAGALYAGVVGYVPQPYTIIQSTGNANNYIQINNQNTNNGTNASTDFVATMDTGNTTVGYIDMGINSSGFTNGAGNELNYPGDGYLYVQGNAQTGSGNLLLSTSLANDIIFALNGQGSANEIARFNNAQSALLIKSLTASTNTTSGALQVAGGAGIGGRLYVGTGIQNTVIGNVTPNTGAFTTLTATGNLIAGLSQFAAINSTPIGNINPSTGTFTNINSTGNVIAQSAIFNSLQINGNETITGYLSVSGNVLASTVGASFLTASTVAVGNIAAVNFGNTGATFTGASLNVSGNILASTIIGTTAAFSGNVIGGLAQFSAINNTPIGNASPAAGTFTSVNSTGNILAQAATFSSATVNGLVNTTGNILATGATFNNLQVNGNETVTGYLNVSGNILTSGVITTTMGASGNVIGGLAQFAAINSTPIGNVTPATGTFTSVNSTGNLLATAGTFNSVTVNGNQTINSGYLNVQGNILGQTGTLSTLILNSSTNSTQSTGTGALQVTGGASFGQDVFVQGNIYAANIIGTGYQYLAVQDPLLYLQGNVVYPYNYSLGFYSHFVGGPGNTYQHTGMVRDSVDGYWKIFSNVAEPSAGTVNFSNAIYDGVKAGNLILTNPVASTSTTTGALQVAGGAGVQGTLVAGQINSTGNVLGQAATFNALTINGNETVTGYLNVSGNILATVGVFGGVQTTGEVYANSSQAVSGISTSIGALVVPNGGAAISGALNLGGTAQIGVSSANYVSIIGTATGGYGVIRAGGEATNGLLLSAGGTGNIVFNAVTSATVGTATNFLVYNATQAGATNYLIVAGTTTGNSPILSTDGTDSNSGIIIKPKGTGNVTISATNTSTSTTTGALTVVGGVGISGTLNAAQINSTGNVLASTIIASYVTASTMTVGNIAAVNFGNTGATFTGSSLNVSGNVLASTIIASYVTASTMTVGNIAAVNFGNTGATFTGSSLNVSGNVLAASLSAGQINTTGNVLATAGTFNAVTVNGNTSVSGYLDITGNVLSAAITTSNVVVNTGNVNVNGGYFVGNGYFLTGVVSTSTQNIIQNNVSNVIVQTGGNILANVNGTVITAFNPTGITVTGNVNASGNVLGQVGTFNGLIVNGNETLNGYLNASGNVLGSAATFNGLTVNGNETLNGYLNASGNILTPQLNAGQINTTGNVLAVNFVGSALNVSGNILASTIIASYYNGSTATFGNISAVTIGNTGATITGTTGTFSGNVIGGLAQFASINNTPIGNITSSSGAFTTLSASAGIWANSSTDTSSTTTGAIVIPTGGLSVAGNAYVGKILYVGGASAFTVNLTTPTIIAVDNGSTYAQMAQINTGLTGSADFIAYPGDYPGQSNDHGWMDMGFTGTAFNDNNYSITKPQDGYLFASAANASVGGNLVLATDHTGNFNDIVFGVGSFLNTAEVARFHGNVGNNGNLRLSYATVSTTPQTGALTVVGGVGVGGNLRVGGGAVINANQTHDPFIVNGAVVSGLIYADVNNSAVTVGGGGFQGNGSTSTTLGVSFKVQSTDSMMLPIGTTSQRPGGPGGNVALQGMVRFNTTINNLEFYDGAQWQTSGSSFTVISDRQFSGNSAYGNVDGVNTVYTIQSNATTTSTLVSINGVMQFPTLAYSVSGSTLTFTEAPSVNDVIDVRILTTTTTVSGITSSTGVNQFSVDSTGASIWTGTSVTNERVLVDTTGNFNFLTGNKVTYDQTAINIPSTGTPTQIDSWSQTAYTSAKYLVQAKVGTTNFETYEVHVLTDGAGNAYLSTYGIVNNGTTFGSLSAVVTSGNVVVRYSSTIAQANVKAMGTFIV